MFSLIYILMVYILIAICKPRQWNLGIGNGIRIEIGIGSETINTIISSSIRSMDTKRSRVVI